jgi:hypothetical protein
MTNFENNALLYAEKYGIIEYEVKGSTMSYTVSYYGEGTYLAEVDLNTMNETRTLVKGS